MRDSDEPIRLEVEADGVAVVSLHRPEKLNIYNLAMRDALIEAFTAVADDPEVRALLLRADGRHFSAGADLSEFGSAGSVMAARAIRWRRDPWIPLWTLPQPTVVALHGYALGAGLEMALLCDVRLAASDTKVGLPETRLGMLPSAGGTQSLVRAIGPAAALPLILTAATIDAQDAVRRGVLTAVVDDVEVEARAVASRLAGLPSAVAQATRRALRAAVDLPLAGGLDVERRLARRATPNP
ncbi:MAG: enoyl-CoA hydratase/isomerase family protein [Acidimicrobiales bacterium]|nr:enoyl-CoA hydratase/isomerase family protein [Acidimicrobiales bacterium]